MASVRVGGRATGKPSYGNALKENGQLLKFLSKGQRNYYGPLLYHPNYKINNVFETIQGKVIGSLPFFMFSFFVCLFFFLLLNSGPRLFKFFSSPCSRVPAVLIDFLLAPAAARPPSPLMWSQ